MTSVSEVTAEEGREKFLCTQPKLNREPLAYETRMVEQDHCQCTLWPLFLLRDKGKRTEMTETQHVGTLKHQFLHYSARKAIILIVEVAYAGGAHMILVVLTVSLVPSA
jgi:hypothetical protein